jgi:hypothetical protein
MQEEGKILEKLSHKNEVIKMMKDRILLMEKEMEASK